MAAKSTVKAETTKPQLKRDPDEIIASHSIKEEEKPSKNQEEAENEDEDEDEEDDDDYDPDAKPDPAEVEEEDDDDDDDNDESSKQPDFSTIQASTTQVKTRSQRQREGHEEASKFVGGFRTDSSGLVRNIEASVDIDAIFNDLKTKSESNDWKELVKGVETKSEEPTIENDTSGPQKNDLHPQKIQIEFSYTFAGRINTETKLVDADSAEAKAYLNSTASITKAPGAERNIRSFVPVIRTIPGTTEPVELKIKLKRPSLIDNFLAAQGSKKSKLSTLEKSRLDWASFVDKRAIGDELKLHNKAGYLDKQEFLGRLQDKQDVQYQKAKDIEKQRQWQLQQK